MPHKIEIFMGNCELCRDFLDTLIVGKCAKCELVEHRIDNKKSLAKAEKYKIKVVPTVVIDGIIKIEGKPDFPFVCSDEFYGFLKKNYSM